jgi:membrane associated rhomboid family serine protease
MIPIGDSLRTRTVPYVNIAIIAINILVFLYELTLDSSRGLLLDPSRGLVETYSELDRFFSEWGTIPACVSDLMGLNPDVAQQTLGTICERGNNTLTSPLTAMFMHAGWLHLLGNMLFLWIFGDNVEEAMGHFRYLVFYLLCGLGASMTHVLVNANDVVPSIGASGAIAGVMGAYLMLYPRATVAVLFPIFLIFWAIPVPAVLLIGVWFVMQVFSGAASIGADVVGGGGGVAWFAHIGGFVLGLLLAYPFRRRRPSLRPIYPEQQRGWRR